MILLTDLSCCQISKAKNDKRGKEKDLALIDASIKGPEGELITPRDLQIAMQGAIKIIDAWVESPSARKEKHRRKKESDPWLQESSLDPEAVKRALLERQERDAKELKQKAKTNKKNPWAEGPVVSSEDKFLAYKERLKQKMGVILEIKGRSPMSTVAATKALKCCASTLGRAADIDTKEFIDLMFAVAAKEGLATRIKPANMWALFNAFDFDDAGILKHAHWVSVVPLFFGIKNYVAFYSELFQELGCEEGLTVQGLEKYLTPYVQMLIPLKEKEMRLKLKKAFSARVFLLANRSGDRLSVEEFVEFANKESMPDQALITLAELLDIDDPDPELVTLGLDTQTTLVI